MLKLFLLAIRFVILVFSGHKLVALENVALSQQLAVFTREKHRPQLRDRDRLFWIALKKLWQNCYAERVIGSIRRECLNHLIVIYDNHLRRILKDYFLYYNESRTHLSLDKDTPGFRAVQSTKSERIIQIPQVGGLHHRYERRAA